MRRSLALVGALVPLLTLSLSAGPAHAQTAPAPPPPGHAAPGDGPSAPRPRRPGLLIGGVATFGVSYAISVMTALDSLRPSNTTSCGGMVACTPFPENNEARDLLIPVAGPWMAMSSAPSRDRALLAVLGIAQVTGVALTIAGVVRYSADGPAAGDSGDAASGTQRASRAAGFISFGVLPTRDGAFGFLSGRM